MPNRWVLPHSWHPAASDVPSTHHMAWWHREGMCPPPQWLFLHELCWARPRDREVGMGLRAPSSCPCCSWWDPHPAEPTPSITAAQAFQEGAELQELKALR